MGKARSPKTFGKKIRDIENDIGKIHTDLTRKQTSLQEVASIAAGPSPETALRNFGNRNNDLTELGEQFPGQTESDIKTHFDVLTDPTTINAVLVPVNFYAVGSGTSVTLTWVAPQGANSATRYEVRYSTSFATNTDGSPSGTDTVTVTGVAGVTHTVTGLAANTLFYFWIRTVQGTENSTWVGYQQTNTDPNEPTLASLNFSVTPGSLSNAISWAQPSGRSLTFNLYRTDPDGNFIRLASQVSTTSFTDTMMVMPQTQYTYDLYVYDETSSLLATRPTSTVTTTAIAAPTITATATGVKITVNITFPIKVGLADVQTATNSTFTTGVTNQSFTRNTRTAVQTLPFVLSPVFNISSTYYVRVRLRYDDAFGTYSSGVSVTTGSIPQASRPTLNVTSPSTGQVRISIRFQDSTSYGDIAAVSYRLQSSVGDYTSYQSYARDNPPSDDLDSDERDIEVIRSGFSPGTQYTFRVVIVRPQATESQSRTDNVLVDN